MCKVIEEMRKQKFAEGKAEGKAEGQKTLGLLISKLLNAGRFADVKAAAEDPVARKQLMIEFGIAGA